MSFAGIIRTRSQPEHLDNSCDGGSNVNGRFQPINKPPREVRDNLLHFNRIDKLP